MNIYQSIAAVMSESIAVKKEKTNVKQNFKYRGIDDVMNTFYPLLSKHKVFIVPEVLEQVREERKSSSGGNLIYSVLKIKYTFYAEDGSSIAAVVIGEGMDSGDKASNKAMAIAMKYAMFQVFCIPTEDMSDPDGDTPPENERKEVQPEPTIEDAHAFSVKTAQGETIMLDSLTPDKLNTLAESYPDKTMGKCAKLLLEEAAQKLKEEKGLPFDDNQSAN